MLERSLAGSDATQLAIDALRAGARVSLVATGHSMTPAIRGGDRLTIEPLWAAPRIGDVLAGEIDGRLVVHRVVARRRGGIELRGDVAPASDPPLPAEALLGKVVHVERGGRRVSFGLGPERVLQAWLSRCGLLRAAARWRERVGNVLFGGRFRLTLRMFTSSVGSAQK
jgi:hypothetical protein